jgi:predicted O-methyltransferase YrrM
VVSAIDADRNGEISAEEIQNATAALKALDKNQDGKLAGEEMIPQGPQGQAVGRREGREGRAGGPGAPGGSGPGAPGAERQGRPGSEAGTTLSTPPAAKDDEEKKILAVLDDLDRNQRAGNMNVPIVDGRLIRLLEEAIGAKHVVEIGTSNGYSGIWSCLALRKTGGRLTTFEYDAGRAKLARENFKRAGVEGIVTLVEGDAHETVKKLEGPIDLAFIDADKEGYVDYLKKLLPLVRPGGLILGHNMSMRQAAIAAYIEAVTKDPALETIFFMDGGGMSITVKKR